MIADCFHETPADGLTGAIMFVEGIEDAAVLLNGPTGCKFYHGAICESQMPRIDALDPLRYSEEFYFGQPRVPATYLDGSDYVFGATGKLEKILDRIAASKGHAFIAVVNSPGAALIGDDLERFLAEAKLPVPCAAVENPGFSTSFTDGFYKAALATIRSVRPVRNIRQPKVVNLIGTSLYDRYWEGNIFELKKLLDLCGVKINAVLPCPCAAGCMSISG
jgi:nitrogenase molybdenum-iron protein alpha/beta subunit